MTPFTRRQVLLGGLGLADAGLLAGCTPASGPSPSHRTRTSFPSQPVLSPAPGGRVVEKTLTAGMIQCHNIHHAEAGMMIALGYRR